MRKTAIMMITLTIYSEIWYTYRYMINQGIPISTSSLSNFTIWTCHYMYIISRCISSKLYRKLTQIGNSLILCLSSCLSFCVSRLRKISLTHPRVRLRFEIAETAIFCCDSTCTGFAILANICDSFAILTRDFNARFWHAIKACDSHVNMRFWGAILTCF